MFNKEELEKLRQVVKAKCCELHSRRGLGMTLGAFDTEQIKAWESLLDKVKALQRVPGPTRSQLF